jgi:hypothetical protein
MRRLAPALALLLTGSPASAFLVEVATSVPAAHAGRRGVTLPLPAHWPFGLALAER